MTYNKHKKIIEVLDYLDGKQQHYVELHWHFSEKCHVDIQDSCVVVRNSDAIIRMSMAGTEWCPELVEGRLDPPLGWISRGFDEKMPAPCVRWAGEVRGVTELGTQIEIVSCDKGFV